jgi:hypothetical protein
MTERVIGAALVVSLTLGLSPARCDDAAVENARARRDAARKVYKGILERAQVDTGAGLDPERICLWSRRWMEAERELAGDAEEKVAAVQGHLDRMKERETAVRKMVNSRLAAATDLAAQEFYRLEAERLLAEARAK